MRKRIKHNIYIVTVPNVPTYLVYVVNPSYYHQVFNEGNDIVADDFFSLRCPAAEKARVVRRYLFDVTVKLLPHIELLIYTKPTSFLVGSTNAYGIIFYKVYLLPRLNKFW